MLYDLFDRLERFCDAVPRDVSHTEEFGGLVLFVRAGAGWPFYARPRPDAPAPSAADISGVRQRQRDLGLPEAFEWIHDTHPDLLPVARSAGLAVLEAPLMVLDPAALPPETAFADAAPVRLLDPDDPGFAADLAAVRAVADVAFRTPGTSRGPAGPAFRDAALPDLPSEAVAQEASRMRDGRSLAALVAEPGLGAVASGTGLRVETVAEIAGIGTLPAARRRGHAAAITAALARHLLAAGADLVFLSACNEEIARIYLRLGFRRIGTTCLAEPAPVTG